MRILALMIAFTWLLPLILAVVGGAACLMSRAAKNWIRHQLFGEGSANLRRPADPHLAGAPAPNEYQR